MASIPAETQILIEGEVGSVVVGLEWRATADCAPAASFEGKYIALLNSLWGRGKIKFEHLRKTKDLAATSTETKDGNIAFLKPNRNPGPPPLARPKGRIDRSFSTPFNSSRRIRLAAGRPRHRQDHAAPRLCLKCRFVHLRRSQLRGSPQHLVRLLRLVRTFLRTPLEATVRRDNCLMNCFSTVRSVPMRDSASSA